MIAIISMTVTDILHMNTTVTDILDMNTTATNIIVIIGSGEE